MKPIDNMGNELDAIFSVEPSQSGAFLILESRGGGEGGPRPPRNADYASAFELLLQRLGQDAATLTDIEVYSDVTRRLPIEQRRISASSFPLPLNLATLRETARFRHEIGRASAALGREPGKIGGNPTKRLRLTLLWPNAVGKTSAELENWLAESKEADTASSHLALEEEKPTSDPTELSKRAARAKRRIRGTEGSYPPPVGYAEAARAEATSARFVRDPEVVGWVLNAAGGACEVCDLPAPFVDETGEPFLEVHHVRPLAEGGPDQPDNAVAVCPNCHRRLHHGANKENARLATIAKIERLKDYPVKLEDS